MEGALANTALASLSVADDGLCIAIVGAGPVARAVGHAISAHPKHSLRVVACRSAASAERLCSLLSSDAPTVDPVPTSLDKPFSSEAEGSLMRVALGAVRLVIVAISDDALSCENSVVASQVSALFPHAKYACHTSGALPSSVLDGAAPHVFSMHPAAPFPQTGPPVSLVGTMCAVSGTTLHSLDVGETLAKSFEMHPFRIRCEEVKPLYHAACCMAANFSALAVSTAFSCINSCTEGLSPELGARLVADLSRKAVAAVQVAAAGGIEPPFAFTGPVVRGDSATVKTHISSLSRSSPYVQDFYRDTTIAMVESLVEAGRLDGVVAEQLRAALDD